MSIYPLVINFVPDPIPDDPHWLIFIPEEYTNQLTVDEVATVLDTLFNTSPCLEEITKEEERISQEDLVEAIKSIDPDVDICDELMTGNYVNRCKIIRSHPDEPYNLKAGVSVGNCKIITSRVSEEIILTVSVIDAESVVLDYPVISDQRASWMAGGGPVLRANGNTLYWSGRHTGTIRTSFMTVYDLATISIPGIPSKREYTPGEKQDCELLAFYNDQVWPATISQPPRDIFAVDEYLAAVCGWGNGASWETADEEEQPCADPLAGQKKDLQEQLAKLQDSQSSDMWTTTTTTKDGTTTVTQRLATDEEKREIFGDSIQAIQDTLDGLPPNPCDPESPEPEDPCRQTVLDVYNTSYRPGMKLFDDDKCCGLPPAEFGPDDCLEWKVGSVQAEGLSDEVKANIEAKGTLCRYGVCRSINEVEFIAVGPHPDDPKGCGDIIHRKVVQQRNCCEEVIPLEWDATVAPEVLADNSNCLIGVQFGKPPFTYRILSPNAYFKTAGGSQIQTAITNQSLLRMYSGNICGMVRIQVTDQCGGNITGHIRAVDGRWVSLPFNSCSGYTGESATRVDSLSGNGTGVWDMYTPDGKYVRFGSSVKCTIWQGCPCLFNPGCSNLGLGERECLDYNNGDWYSSSGGSCVCAIPGWGHAAVDDFIVWVREWQC